MSFDLSFEFKNLRSLYCTDLMFQMVSELMPIQGLREKIVIIEGVHGPVAGNQSDRSFIEIVIFFLFVEELIPGHNGHMEVYDNAVGPQT